MFDIQKELKELPPQPGVYLMHDDRDEIIYVGKAISLKNRVRQYFQRGINRSPKIEQMISKINTFEYIITDSELEALILECNLIKEHRPKYNTMLMDDKGYPYIKVTVSEAFPRVLFSRHMKKDKDKYFGPYASAIAVKDTLSLLRQIYKIRTCNRALPRDIGKDRACLNYHIHQCSAPCQGFIDSDAYKAEISKIIDFLNGNYTYIQKFLQQKMGEASEQLAFEKALEYRKLLEKVNNIAQKQKVTDSDASNRDIIACACDESDAVVQVFFIREGKLLGREHFHLSIGPQDTREQIIASFIKQYYSGTPYIPKELIVQEHLTEAEIISQWLSQKLGQKVYIINPKKGEKEKLVELAEKNAQMVLKQDKEKLQREEKRTIGAMQEIADLLELEHIERAEAFDISNTGGFQPVGSMVVYENGKPKRNDYRKFKIQSVKGPDDYASMYEVLKRRFTHGIEERMHLDHEYGSFTKFPDLIMMDGGKGQVNIALKVLLELNLQIPVCGMVKDEHHRTRGLFYNNTEIPIRKDSEGFQLITRIQDEAHRFAISYHKNLRSKNQVHSVLDDIEGIGPARRKALMRHFKSFERIKEASVEELMEVKPMNELAARNVYNFFH